MLGQKEEHQFSLRNSVKYDIDVVDKWVYHFSFLIYTS